MESIYTANDVKRNKDHVCRCVVRWEGITFMVSILFLAPVSMEIAKHMQPESVF